jgi:hypothetical protein
MCLTWTTKHRFSSLNDYCCFFFALAHNEGNDFNDFTEVGKQTFLQSPQIAIRKFLASFRNR